jgi:hypothetical protein
MSFRKFLLLNERGDRGIARGESIDLGDVGEVDASFTAVEIFRRGGVAESDLTVAVLATTVVIAVIDVVVTAVLVRVFVVVVVVACLA